ncbi:MAG: 3-deoxy-D-manno-octulosonic acid transferase [Candidatus Omnitrophota bacterium]
MKFLYDLVFLAFSILYLPYLVVKGKLHRDFLQRFSFLPEEVVRVRKPVWIHAVSVGEAALAGKLALSIKKHFPEIPVVVSTTTKTGNEMIRRFLKSSVDAVFYFPLDMSFIVSRDVKRVDPRLYVMVETELWPNLLEELHSKGVPVVLANGRLSDTSFRNYRKISFIMKRILRAIDSFCMQTEKDAERIKLLGAPPEKVHVTGNIKFDETVGLPGSAAFSRKDFGFGEDDKVLVAGSTHFPEEETIIGIYEELRSKWNDLKLVLAPRHVERVGDLKSRVEKSGIKYSRFSDILSGKATSLSGRDIVLVDTIGHLKDIYSIATLIFVGGSLAKKGGQNPIEGARWGKGVIFGPHMFNFREVANIFIEGGGAVSVKDSGQLKNVLKDLLEDTGKRENMSLNAKRIIESNSGAISKTLEKVEEYLACPVRNNISNGGKK